MNPPSKPGAPAWVRFFEVAETVNDSASYMDERPMNVVPADSGVFDDERA